jgi:hypothetical protein
MRDLKDDMSKGLITFDMVTQAFKDATSEGGRFYNLTEKQSVSFLGRISTLQSQMDIFARDMGTKLLPAAGFVVEKLISLFSVEDDLTTITKKLITKQEKLIKIEKELKNETGTLTDKRKEFLEIQKDILNLDIGKELVKLVKEYKSLTKNYEVFGKNSKENLKVLEFNNRLTKNAIEKFKEWREELKQHPEKFKMYKQALRNAEISVKSIDEAIVGLGLRILSLNKKVKNNDTEFKKSKKTLKEAKQALVLLVNTNKIAAETLKILDEELYNEVKVLKVIKKKVDDVAGAKEKLTKAEIEAAEIKKQLISELLEYQKYSNQELEGMSQEKLEKELEYAKKEKKSKEKLIDELLTYNKKSKEELNGLTKDELLKLNEIYEKNAEETKALYKAIFSGLTKIVTDFNSNVGKLMGKVQSTIAAFQENWKNGLVQLAVNLIIFFKELYEAADRQAKFSLDATIERMEKVELKRAEMAVKALESEKEKALELLALQQETLLESLALDEAAALEKFLLTAQNYENMNQITKNYYDLLMSQEKAKYDAMTSDEKKEYDIKKKYTEDKTKVENEHRIKKEKAEKAYLEKKEKAEKAFNESLKTANIEMAKVQLKIAVAKVESDRAEAESKINAEYWAPWDRDKKIAEWQKMQGMYNAIKSDLESSLGTLGGLQKGGVIKGYGGGDKYNAKLEAGEAVLPKEWQINPIPVFSQLMSMRGATQEASSNISNMSSNSVNFEGANFYFQGSNAQEVIEELQEIAENTNTRVFAEV